MNTQVAQRTQQNNNGIAGALAATTEHLLTALRQLCQTASCPPEFPMYNANFWTGQFESYFFGCGQRRPWTMHTALRDGIFPIGFLRERIAQINELIVDEAKRHQVQHKLVRDLRFPYAESEYDVESF